MDFRYVKSVVYLVGFGGLGWSLLQYCNKDESTIAKEAKEFPGGTQDPREAFKEKKNYLNLLKASAASDKPLYRMSKAEIDAELRRK